METQSGDRGPNEERQIQEELELIEAAEEAEELAAQGEEPSDWEVDRAEHGWGQTPVSRL